MKRSTFLKRIGLTAIASVVAPKVFTGESDEERMNALFESKKNDLKSIQNDLKFKGEVWYSENYEDTKNEFENILEQKITVHNDIRIGDNVMDKILGVKGVVSDVLDDNKFIVAVIGTEGMIVRKAEELYTIYRL